MGDATVERQLTWIRELSDGLGRDILELPAAAWDIETNCAPWRVRDGAAHVVTGGERFALSIRRGLEGSTEPPAGADASAGGRTSWRPPAPRPWWERFER